MSIVPLKKITIYGCLEEKLEALDTLQHFGCLHITSLVKKENLLDKGSESPLQTLEAFRHLRNSPQKLKPITNASNFDPEQIKQQILQNKHQIKNLQDEADGITHKIEELLPWGHFVLPDPKEMGNQRFWFYVVPHHEMKQIKKIIKCAESVQKDPCFYYLVVIAGNEPENIPGKQVKLPTEPLNVLKARLEQIEFELEDLHIERLNLTRWLELFRKNLFKLEDQLSLANASQKTYDTSHLFVLQGWIPASKINGVTNDAKIKGLAIKIEEAATDELPPTLLENPSPLQGGEDLLSFYMTPSYRLWDPSTTVFFSFALFFAMIFSDAGYAILLGAALAFFWKHLGTTLTGKRFRNVLLALTVFSLIWGILVGSYFGLSPSSNHFLSKFKIFDMTNYSAMMLLAICVGVTHISIANLAQAWAKRDSLTALAHIGWTTLLIGATGAFMGFKIVGLTLFIIGIIAIVLFTSIEKPFWKRFLSGLMGLTRITGMFGDVLSYLRLFALGLASASLAAVFNDLAKQIYLHMSGFKLLFAVLILLIGHGINFMLSLMGGFIHGLRLNFIEFFNWGLPEEGAPFKAFEKKETSKWNH